MNEKPIKINSQQRVVNRNINVFFVLNEVIKKKREEKKFDGRLKLKLKGERRMTYKQTKQFGHGILNI